MIQGLVNLRHEAVIRLRVRGPTGLETAVDAVIDTGFSGSLTLPTADVVALGLSRQSGGQAVLADGSIQQFDVYAAEVEWDGGWRPIVVSSIGEEALVVCDCCRVTRCELKWFQLAQ